MADVTIHVDTEAEYEAALAWYLARTRKRQLGSRPPSRKRSRRSLPIRNVTPCVMTAIGFAFCAGIPTASSTAWTEIKFGLWPWRTLGDFRGSGRAAPDPPDGEQR